MPIARTFLEFLSSYSQRVSGWSESAQLENYLPDPLLPLLLLLLPKLACAPCKYNNTTTNTRKMPIQIQFQIKIQLSARPAASSTAPAAAQTYKIAHTCGIANAQMQNAQILMQIQKYKKCFFSCCCCPNMHVHIEVQMHKSYTDKYIYQCKQYKCNCVHYHSPVVETKSSWIFGVSPSLPHGQLIWVCQVEGWTSSLSGLAI